MSHEICWKQIFGRAKESLMADFFYLLMAVGVPKMELGMQGVCVCVRYGGPKEKFSVVDFIKQHNFQDILSGCCESRPPLGLIVEQLK